MSNFQIAITVFFVCLAGAIAVAAWAIISFKRIGSMQKTPLEQAAEDLEQARQLAARQSRYQAARSKQHD